MTNTHHTSPAETVLTPSGVYTPLFTLQSPMLKGCHSDMRACQDMWRKLCKTLHESIMPLCQLVRDCDGKRCGLSYDIQDDLSYLTQYKDVYMKSNTIWEGCNIYFFADSLYKRAVLLKKIVHNAVQLATETSYSLGTKLPKDEYGTADLTLSATIVEWNKFDLKRFNAMWRKLGKMLYESILPLCQFARSLDKKKLIELADALEKVLSGFINRSYDISYLIDSTQWDRNYIRLFASDLCDRALLMNSAIRKAVLLEAKICKYLGVEPPKDKNGLFEYKLVGINL